MIDLGSEIGIFVFVGLAIVAVIAWVLGRPPSVRRPPPPPEPDTTVTDREVARELDARADAQAEIDDAADASASPDAPDDGAATLADLWNRRGR